MVSIIIPVYNSEAFLPEMLNSVLDQSYTDVEIILVNDGSKDNSGKICQAYAEKYDCVKAFDRENHGASASRNFGLEQASGEFVWFLDSDDVLAEGALQTAVMMQNKYDADVVIGGMNFCFANKGKIVPKVVEEEFAFNILQFENYYEELFSRNYISSLCNKLIRRSVILENKIRMIEHLHMYEDYVFCMDLLLKCEKIACVPMIFYHYQFRNSQSLSHRYKSDILAIFLLLKAKIEEYRTALSRRNKSADICLSNFMIYLAYECVKNEARSSENPRAKIKELLCNKDFHDTMLEFNSYGARYRVVHALMKRRLSVVLFFYLKQNRN